MKLHVPTAEETKALLGSIAAPNLPQELVEARVAEIYGLN